MTTTLKASVDLQEIVQGLVEATPISRVVSGYQLAMFKSGDLFRYVVIDCADGEVYGGPHADLDTALFDFNRHIRWEN